MPSPRVIIVCLPTGTPTNQLATAATAKIGSTPLTATGPAGHFTHTTRLRRRSLLSPRRDLAAGGPIRLLDLDAMRVAARDSYLFRWQIWHQVVAGTKPASPYWVFLDRHHAEPAKYSLVKAQQQYRAQPRIAAMAIYNALPNKILHLPTSHLEAFQAGDQAYAHFGLLSRIPADGMLTLDGRYLAPASDRLADQLSYLDAAQRQLSTLRSRDILVALTTA